MRNGCRQVHRQESIERQRRLTGQWNQSVEKVNMSSCWMCSVTSSIHSDRMVACLWLLPVPVNNPIWLCQTTIYWSTNQPCFDRLNHPNIVRLVETFEDRGKVYLVMELWAFYDFDHDKPTSISIFPEWPVANYSIGSSRKEATPRRMQVIWSNKYWKLSIICTRKEWFIGTWR